VAGLSYADLMGVKGAHLAKQAVEAMARHSVPPTPTNYEVWLSYVAGANSDVKRQIDQMIAEKQPFTSLANEALYEQFFGSARLALQMAETSERIAEEVNAVVSSLQTAGAQNKAFGGELSAAGAKLEQGMDPVALREMVASLARTTKEMVTANAALTSKLEDAGREVTQMRETLSVARAEALTDALTGIANRKSFDQTLRMRVDEAHGTKTSLCLMMCDIDFFKKFNDTWGHHTGDQVIRFVATAIQKNALGDMLAARYGGEEFALIIPRHNLQKAREIVEEIRQQVESKNLVRKSTGEDLGRISISAGVAQLCATDTAVSLLERADELLYASKKAGRNCVTTEADAMKLAVA
jgi:diguanylate cyclase